MRKRREKQPAASVESSSASPSPSPSPGASPSTSTSTSNNQQGKAWGIFHVIKYQQLRHQVQKRLKQKKPANAKNPNPPIDFADTLEASGFDNTRERHDPNSKSSNAREHREPIPKLSNVEETLAHGTLRGKQSVKARLKALISEEIARKKGRHKRSSTFPVKPQLTQLPPTPISNLDRSDLDLVARSLPRLPQTPTINNDICVECGTKFSTDCTTQTHKHKQPLYHQASYREPSTHDEEKSMHARLLTTDVSPHLFKDFLDALDIINTNKDMLLKFLQHPRSPMLTHIQDQTAKTKVNKSVSFPAPTGETRLEPNESQAHSASIDTTSLESSEQFHQHSLPLESSNNRLETTSSRIPLRTQNYVVLKRFKDLREKLKHVIEENRNEKRRITMDAVHHKIPRGNKLSNDELKKKILQLSKDPVLGDSSSQSEGFNKRQVSPLRTSSLNESVGRYSQLYETCFNRETKYPKSERLKLKEKERNSVLKKTQKCLQRFLSLPNLETYFSQGEEPSSSVLPPRIPVMKICREINITPEIVSRSFQKEIGMRSGAGLGSDEDKEELNQKESIGTADDFGKLTDSDSSELDSNESNFIVAEAKSNAFSDFSYLYDTIDFDEDISLPEDSEIKPGPTAGLDHLSLQLQEANIDHHQEAARRSKDDFINSCAQNKRLDLGIPRPEVVATSEAEFNYVKDVLELSGFFTSQEPLEIWYSHDQPIDPIVYEELERIFPFDPETSGKNCNRLRLFDLINEVLVDILGRSHSYYPKPLSSLSHIHPKLAVDQVVQEVWTSISWCLGSKSSELHPSLDYYVSRDLARSDGWMNLQFDSECVGLELDDMIFNDLLEEIICCS